MRDQFWPKEESLYVSRRPSLSRYLSTTTLRSTNLTVSLFRLLAATPPQRPPRNQTDLEASLEEMKQKRLSRRRERLEREGLEPNASGAGAERLV